MISVWLYCYHQTVLLILQAETLYPSDIKWQLLNFFHFSKESLKTKVSTPHWLECLIASAAWSSSLKASSTNSGGLLSLWSSIARIFSRSQLVCMTLSEEHCSMQKGLHSYSIVGHEFDIFYLVFLKTTVHFLSANKSIVNFAEKVVKLLPS